MNYRVTQIRITDIIANTYYARIHLGRQNPNGGADLDAVDVDARPSDAINLAVRFNAPMCVAERGRAWRGYRGWEGDACPAGSRRVCAWPCCRSAPPLRCAPLRLP